MNWLNKLLGVKFGGKVLDRFNAFQNPTLCCKNHDLGKCRNGVNIPEWNYNICKLLVNFITKIPIMSIDYHSLFK